MGRIYTYPLLERVRWGDPFDQAVAEEADRLGAARVFLMAGGTLSRETDWPDRLEKALGGRLVGRWTRMGAHSPRGDVVDCANAARDAGADLIITLGGGSVTDAGKMVRLCLANAVTEPGQLDAFVNRMEAGRRIQAAMQPPAPAQICIPITLSAGEFSATAGCTDTVRNLKQSFAHPRMFASAVILDPAVTVNTPEWLFLSTGIRAVDHAVEDICSSNGHEFAEGASLQALRLLTPGLRGVKRDARDMQARQDCLLGAWMSMMGSQSGVMKGASHGIGHALGGTAGMPHGYTSCVMLPTVLRFNHPVNAAKQALVAEAMGQPRRPAADCVQQLVADLGLPTRLRDAGMQRDQLDAVAAASMHDRFIPTNPRPLPDAASVRTLLDMAW